MAEPITIFHTRFYDSPVGKIAILTMDNGQDYKKPNTFSEGAMVSLNKALDRIVAEEDVKGPDADRKTLHFCGRRRS